VNDGYFLGISPKQVKRKVLLIVTFSLLVLQMVFSSQVNASPSAQRLAGNTQYDTSSVIAKKGWSQSDYAILAYGENFPDALAAAPLAHKYDAPILLTENQNLTPVIKQTLQDLKVKNVFIVGGNAVISSTVENQIKEIGINVTRLAGNDQYDTAIEIAKQLGTIQKVSVVTGGDFTDALSIASVSAINNSPIILVPKDYLPESVKSYLNSNIITNSYIVGGTGLISDSVASEFPNAERISGTEKYDTNIAVLKRFDVNYDSKTVFIATGNGFADALSGTAYASKVSAPIILLSNTPSETTKSYYKQRLTKANNVYVFGGTGIIPDSVIQGLTTIAPTVIPTTPVIDPTTPSSLANPYPLNISQTIVVKDYSDDYTAQVTVKQIIRGQEAWTMINERNRFNSKPKEGYEYILAKISVKLLDIAGGKALDLNGNFDFELVSQNGKTYDSTSVVNPDPDLDSSLYKGAFSEGWSAFLVKTDDTKPVLSYGTKYDGSGGIWFRAYNEGVDTTPTPEITPEITPEVTPETDTSHSPQDVIDVLQDKYSTLETPIGTLNFTYSFLENDHDTLPYDYSIKTDWSGFAPYDLDHSIKISDSDKAKTKELLRGLQKNVAQEAIKLTPNKKIAGGFYHGFYEYPNLRVGYKAIRFLSWINFNFNASAYDYKSTKVNNFQWSTSGDNFKW